ncbi:hypothetical protein IVB12_17475 [Bradyrhizobium sp. 179]|uniref:hypothetical protein n=1 Tax=Bradyrhizobium sp. 179 TaxID=2782648 RepID=UPI001FFC1D60|nr:hypothetical protein [Bradyrhizobium sp. 179]MCK1543701.1 hypothetical protein [Bradyrhizobium sp. 179]
MRGVALFRPHCSDLANQLEACQPSGNGTNGQTVWLSLAAFGGCWADVFTIGTGAVDRSAKRRHAHCKFIVVAPAGQLFSKYVSG